MTRFDTERTATLEREIAALREAADEYLAEQDEAHWCQRIKYGGCALRKCNVEGGWEPGNPCDFSRATCARFRLELARTTPLEASHAIEEGE